MVTTTRFDAKGSKKGDASLPAAFETAVRPDLIRKAVSAARANRRQRYGAAPMAGAMHSSASAGKGRGLSRVPRIQGSGTAALAPPVVGGRRAHPPTARKDWTEKINRKERRLAIKSALAATASVELVKARGHRLGDDVKVPFVITDDLEQVSTSKAALELFTKMGLGDELARARDGVHVRAGRGKTRGRRLRRPVSILVVANDAAKLRRGAGNLPGVQVTTPRGINAELLAPGGDAGRLTIFTEGALKQLEEL